MDYHETPDTFRCIFPDKVDTASTETFEGELYDRIGKTPRPVVFDLQNVQYAGSAFLRICVNVSRKIGHDRLCLVNVPPAVRKVIEVSHLAGQLNIR